MTTNDNSNFPATRISLIERIQDLDGKIRRQALDEFAKSYRPALISFLVKCKKIGENEAEDIVQDFMLNKIMNGKVMELAGKKGRFRALLRTCLQNHLIDGIRKTGKEPTKNPLNLAERDFASPENSSPIDQAWAIAVFREALLFMKSNSEYWGVFLDRVLTQPPLPYDQIIERYEFDNPSQASNALMTAKRQFNRIMQDQIAKQTYLTDESTEADVRSDIEYLRHQLADSKLVEVVIESLKDIDEPKPPPKKLDSVFGDRLLFIDDSADANWVNTDAQALIKHLLNQPLNAIVPESNEVRSVAVALGIAGEESTNLETIERLKQHFNQNAKTGVDPLPHRINICMTFLCIACYLLAGGKLEKITSTRRLALAERLSQLTDKTWLPGQVTEACRNAVEFLNDSGRHQESGD